MKKIVTILYILIILNSSTIANDESNDISINHMALATLMVYDAKYDKAREELKLVDKKSAEFDKAKLYTILGVIASKEALHVEAIEHFKKAITATQNKVFKAPKLNKKEKYLFSIASSEKKIDSKESLYDAKKIKAQKLSQLYIYLSQSYYKIKDYKNTIVTLDAAGKRGEDRSALFSLRAECYKKIDDNRNSISSLNRGIKLFPQEYSLLKQKFYYLADLKLYQSSIEVAKEYIDVSGNSSKEYLSLAQLLLQASQIDEAIKILEEAKLKFPKKPKLGVVLAYAYLQKDMKFSAADIYEISSIYDKKYVTDAVEMHRQVGNLAHAIYLNSKMSNKTEKFKQKIAIYLDRKEFAKVIGLKNGLKRYKLLEDDNIRYALAYAYYMSKDYDNAEKHLKKISDNELFTKATIIRKNIQMCRDDSMECI